ncbi:MAG: hypothetical protein AAF655_12805 [Bacteroidota bacterium]
MIDELYNLLKEDEVEKALALIELLLKPESHQKSIYESVLILQSRVARLNKQRMEGLVDRSTFDVYRNQINSFTIKLIKDLSSESFYPDQGLIDTVITKTGTLKDGKFKSKIGFSVDDVFKGIVLLFFLVSLISAFYFLMVGNRVSVQNLTGLFTSSLFGLMSFYGYIRLRIFELKHFS